MPLSSFSVILRSSAQGEKLAGDGMHERENYEHIVLRKKLVGDGNYIKFMVHTREEIETSYIS